MWRVEGKKKRVSCKRHTERGARCGGSISRPELKPRIECFTKGATQASPNAISILKPHFKYIWGVPVRVSHDDSVCSDQSDFGCWVCHQPRTSQPRTRVLEHDVPSCRERLTLGPSETARPVSRGAFPAPGLKQPFPQAFLGPFKWETVFKAAVRLLGLPVLLGHLCF